MNVDTPKLLPGEQYIPGGSIGSATLYTTTGYVSADAGEMWGTNYRIIFRFYVSIKRKNKKTKIKKKSFAKRNNKINNISKIQETGEFSVPYGTILNVEKNGTINNKEQFSLNCRDMTVEIFAVPIDTKIKKDLIRTILKFIGVRSSKKLFCFSHPMSNYKENGWNLFDIMEEYKRQGIKTNDWRQVQCNSKYEFCATYPPKFVVPSNVTDEIVYLLGQVHVKGRVQVLTWGSGNGSYLLRCSVLNIISDDLTGITGSSAKPNDVYVQKIAELFQMEQIFIISTLNKKVFPIQLYQGIGDKCNIQCLSLPTDLQYQESIKSLFTLCTSSQPITSTWLEEIDKTGWLDNLSSLLRGAVHIATRLEDRKIVIAQNEDGQSLLNALCAISQLLIDPFYRTIKGLCILIEKEFMHFGHRFGYFTGNKKSNDEFSYIFVIFLDCVWQIMQQFPLSFEYEEEYLLFLINSCYSCQFGTFIPSCEKERQEYMKKSPSLWSYILENSNSFKNVFYRPFPIENKKLPFDPDKLRLRLWSGYYIRHRCRFSVLKADKAIQTAFSKKVNSFEFSSLKLPTIPCDSNLSSNLSGLKNITSINLSDNIINKIPLSLCEASNLKHLYLNKNLIPFISEEYLDLFTSKILLLETLELNNNQILELSELIYRFKNLKSLKLHGNLLKSLPDLSKFKSLLELDIGANLIDKIPTEIFCMKTLESLNISSNNMELLPNSIVDLLHLKKLDISSIPIKNLPCNFQNLCNLTSLNISNIDLQGIPIELFSFKNLKSLSLAGLHISSLPDEISNFNQLEYFDLSNNVISKINPSLFLLKNLKYLFLRNNKLVHIPLDISNLEKLIELHLDHNLLKGLSAGVGNLFNLRILNVSYNNIINIPGCVGYLDKLKFSKQFNFSQNKHLKKPPPDIITRGNDSIFKYLQSLLQGCEQIYRMKIMLVGQENVGKTSLLRSLTEFIANKRKVISSNSSAGIDKTLSSATGLTSMSTDGIDIGQLDFKVQIKNEPGNNSTLLSGGSGGSGGLSGSSIRRQTGSITKAKVDLSVWDFAGQEIYYTTHQFFLSDRALYIVVFNMAKNEEDSRVEYWLKSINARVPDAPILIVGTHADDPICTKEYQNDVLKALQNKYCSQYPNIFGIHAISCISQDGILSLDDLIQNVVISQPFMGENIPRTFIELENLINVEKLERKPPVISWDEFTNFGRICNIRDQNHLSAAASWLHNMGTIIYFQKHEGLNDIVILDPQWLTDVMSSIITTKHAFVKNGVLQHSTLPQLWRAPEFPPYLHSILLNLLEKFEISYYLRSTQDKSIEDKSLQIYTGKSLVPSLLPDNRPNIEKFWSHFPDHNEKQFGRKYKFGFIPHGFISRLFVRILHFAEPTVFWKNGMLVEHNDDAQSSTISDSLIQGYFAILIEARPAQKIIEITIRGSAEKLAQLIIETVDNLIHGWYSIRVDIEVPCIHCIRDNSYSPFMFTIESCEQAAIDGKAFIKCSDIRDIRLDELVPDIAMIHVKDCKLDHDELVIDKEIGVGGFAIVYKGTYNNKVVAIKKIKFGNQDQPSIDDTTEIEAFAEFRREVWLMSGLFHLNIVQMEGFSLDPFCIVTEFIHHGNLYDLIHNQSFELSWSYRWRCAMDIAKGMKYLHTTSWPPIIHRDLKSPNVLIDSLDDHAEVIAKVADFGLSQVLASTTQGRSVANPVWLAPEIMKSEEYTEKADVYSYGVILYELASRQNFFGDCKFMSALENRVIEGERPSIPNSTPPEFSKIIQSCWDGEPDNRPSFIEIVDHLTNAMKIYCPTIVEIACADKEIIPDRKRNLKKQQDEDEDDDERNRRKVRTEEEIAAEAMALENARKQESIQEMNSISHTLNQLHDTSVQCLLYLPPCLGRDESQVWSGASDGTIAIWSLNGNQIETIMASQKQIFSMILVNNETVWVACGDHIIRIYLARVSFFFSFSLSLN